MRDYRWGMHEKPRARQHEKYRRRQMQAAPGELSRASKVYACVLALAFVAFMVASFAGWSP